MARTSSTICYCSAACRRSPRLGQPLLVGVSRKGFIGKILELDPTGRLEGSLAAAVAAVLAGANIVRVHDVGETCRAARDRRRDPLRRQRARESSSMLELIRQFRWQDCIDIGIITFLIYRLLQIVRGSRAMQMIIGLAVILVALCLVARARAVYAQLDSRQLSRLDHSGHHRDFSKRYPARADAGGQRAAVCHRRAHGAAARRHHRGNRPSGGGARGQARRRADRAASAKWG